MSRYIDADALEYDTEWSEYHDGFTAYSQMAIDTAPSIDIVRCKECKYEAKCNTNVHFLVDGKIDVMPLDFCSYGERKTENNSEKPNNCEPQTERKCVNCKFLTYRFGKTWCDIKCDNPHDIVCDKWTAQADCPWK